MLLFAGRRTGFPGTVASPPPCNDSGLRVDSWKYLAHSLLTFSLCSLTHNTFQNAYDCSSWLRSIAYRAAAPSLQSMFSACVCPCRPCYSMRSPLKWAPLPQESYSHAPILWPSREHKGDLDAILWADVSLPCHVLQLDPLRGRR